MIAVDTNILAYSTRADSPWHEAALRCVVGLAESDRPWAIAWPCVHEFLAVVTHPKIYRPATEIAVALEQVEAWMESPGLRLLGERPGYWGHLRTLVQGGAARGPMVHDARVAAICRAEGVREIWSADRDYSRFPGLVVRNPLVG